ncbi:MAG TPA: Gfo/Idh/MocA family oxidoreductase [Stellaceae bacterium]|nr:Gfo/Idh/MocA family oxidoreductase [Stellaceae bacterium]
MSELKSHRVLGVGLVGLGGAAVNMLPSFERSSGFAIVAAADADREVLERFGQDYPGVDIFSSVERLATSPRVDLVYVGTPTRLHGEHARAALERGKHVLVEKPMAVTFDEADAMIALAERNGVLLGVNVKHSFEPRILKLRALVRSGELGALRMVHNWRYVDWLYRPRSRAEKTPGRGSGILWRQGPHQFDLIRTICGGLLRSVRGAAAVFDRERPVPGAYAAFFECENGIAGTVICSGYDHFSSRQLVAGFAPITAPDRYAPARRALDERRNDPNWEENEAEAERYGGRETARRGANSGPSSGWLLAGPLIASFDRGDVRLTRTGLIVDGDEMQWEIPVLSDRDGRDGRLASYYRAVVDRQPLAADGRWGKATQEVVEAIERSAQTRTEIMLRYQVPVVDVDESAGLLLGRTLDD